MIHLQNFANNLLPRFLSCILGVQRLNILILFSSSMSMELSSYSRVILDEGEMLCISLFLLAAHNSLALATVPYKIWTSAGPYC